MQTRMARCRHAPSECPPRPPANPAARTRPRAWSIGRRSFTESQHRRLTLLAMCVATFMIQLDVTIVNVALPSIQTGLGMSPGGLEWVISAYALSLAALIPVGGALGDRYGRKRLFLIGMTIFSIASACCALSASAAALIASRAVQGVGGAAMLALTLSIITETFAAEGRAHAIGTWAAIGGTGFGAGPVCGGILLTYFGWASVFWVNVPFGIVAIVGTAIAVRETRNSQSPPLDVAGVVTSSVGLVAVALGLIESASHSWGSWPVAAPCVLGVTLLAGFALWERHTPYAMVPPRLLRARSFVGACGVYLIGYAAFSGALFYVTLLYQGVNGWSVLRTGLSWLFMNGPFLLMARLAGWLDLRFRASTVTTTGCLAAAVGILALSTAGSTTPFILTAVGYVVSGAGFGILTPGTAHVAMRDVPTGVSGAASGILNASRQIGTSIGLAVLGTIGVNTAVSSWRARAHGFPDSMRAAALRQAPNVGGARISAITRNLGSTYRHPAAESFVDGYHLAVSVAATCLVIAALVAIIGFSRTTAATDIPTARNHRRAIRARARRSGGRNPPQGQS